MFQEDVALPLIRQLDQHAQKDTGAESLVSASHGHLLGAG